MSGSYFSEDTIAAIATSQAGDGGVGIIRISGPRARAAARILCPAWESQEPRYLHRIEIQNPQTGEILDDGLGVYFPKGQSFTGEDVVELQLHGGMFLLQSVLRLLLADCGCRLALPGEFSFRAVRNGKLDLAGAAALRRLIEARSLFEIRGARKAMGAGRGREFEAMAEAIRNLLAQTELSIDFIDQDVEVISADGMRAGIGRLLERTGVILAQLQAAQRIAQGLTVTLAGAPNAGKSTLFNALLAEDRAIVSPEAGTTRDVITEELSIGPYRVRLADTAGIREGRGSVELEGIARARDLTKHSDLVLFVVDCTREGEEVRRELKQRLTSRAIQKDSKTILVLNKSDLATVGRMESLTVLGREFGMSASVVSAEAGAGIVDLLSAIRRELDSSHGAGLDAFLPTEFQLQMLVGCRSALADALGLVEQSGLSRPELLSSALRAAAKSLSDLAGETTPDTVLTKIFSEFCIGK